MTPMRLIILVAISYPLLAAPPIAEQRLKKYVLFLAADSLQGRGAGYPGERKAADYIARQFRDAGLAPRGDGTAVGRSYFQEFTFHPRRPPIPWSILTSRNVVGYLEGSSRKEEVMVLGAHYDGQGREGEADTDRIITADGTDKIWNSADDNASGVAAVIGIARSLHSMKKKPKRSILFVAFGAEEHELNGSVYFVRTLKTRPVAMINVEKIGRVPRQPLITASSGTSTAWIGLIRKANRATGMNVQPAIEELIPDTDHYPFAVASIPAIVIGTAHEEDTHTPQDSADKIAYTALASRANYIAAFVEQVSNWEEAIPFTWDLSAEIGMLTVPATPEEKKMRGVPEQDGALKVSSVLRGGLARQAGFNQGDLIVEINSEPVPAKAPRGYLSELLQSSGELSVGVLMGDRAKQTRILKRVAASK